jgi:transcription elongation GreA/GreB family factor
MSAAEIMAELPRMTVRERREIARRLVELEADVDALRTADETADQGFQILDQMEGDGSAKTR